MCKKSIRFYFQDYSESTSGKITKKSKSKLVCSVCKIGLQSLSESVNFMGVKFDEDNNTVTKLLNEMKELWEEVNKLKLNVDRLENKRRCTRCHGDFPRCRTSDDIPIE